MTLIFRIFLTFVLVTTSVLAHAADNSFGDAGAVLEEETRVFLGPCFFSDIPEVPPAETKFVPSFIGPVLGIALAETVVDFAAGALKAAGEDKSTQAIAAYPANGWMYQLNTNAQLVVNPQSRCIQIISGSFWNGLRVLEGEDFNKVSTRDQTKTVLLDNREKVETTNPSDTVAQWEPSQPMPKQLKAHFRQLRQARFFFEASIEPLQGTDDKFVIAPHAMYLEKPVEQSCFEINPKRNVLVTLTMANAGADVGKAFASVNFPFRDVPSGTHLTPLYFRDHTSRAILAPELTEDEKKSVLAKKAKLNKASSEVQLVKGPPPPPVFVSPNSFENTEFIKAARAYCVELDNYNALLLKQNKAAAKATSPECPVDLQVAKVVLSKASATFTDFATHQEAEFNTSNYWLLPDSDPKSLGVTCEPASDAKGFNTNCALVKPTNVRPMTVSASVVEVKEGNKFAAFLGKVLEKAQPGINAAIEAEKPDAQAAATEQSKVDQEAFQLAVADVATVEASLADILTKPGATSAEIAKCQRDLLDKKIIANQKARKAGSPEPYPIP